MTFTESSIPDLTGRIAVVTGMNYAKFHHTGDGEDPTVEPKSPPYSGPDKKLGFFKKPGFLAALPGGANKHTFSVIRADPRSSAAANSITQTQAPAGSRDQGDRAAIHWRASSE